VSSSSGLRDRSYDRIAATYVNSKGITPYAVKIVQNFLREGGHRKVRFKSDGERAVISLSERASKEFGCSPQEYPEGDHQVNGAAEGAVRGVKRQMKVIGSRLEEKLQVRVWITTMCCSTGFRGMGVRSGIRRHDNGEKKDRPGVEQAVSAVC